MNDNNNIKDNNTEKSLFANQRDRDIWISRICM